jgi:hypothetical protein
MSDAKFVPPPVPPDDRLDHAAEVLSRLSQVEGLRHWCAAFHRDNAECVGVYPRDMTPGDLFDFYVEIPDFFEDPVDMGRSLDDQRSRCRLAVSQGIEAYDFELDVMGRALSAQAVA